MTIEETYMFMAAMAVPYPEFGKQNEGKDKMKATVNLWHCSFEKVPYELMSLVFNRYRMENKWAPKVSEMREGLRKLYYEAEEIATMNRFLGNDELSRKYMAVADACSAYREELPILAQIPAELGEACAGLLHD